ncbi:hypothetical protein [Sulfurihydrogenibium sp.]|uniref:hypothetical protein n=1 Tax=Sulfurihydrogenibium sp. TaxID=2053621 RepID=UPI00262AD3EA|nr:hypothetical protein [Sulfurihydrogenibium sp.]
MIKSGLTIKIGKVKRILKLHFDLIFNSFKSIKIKGDRRIIEVKKDTLKNLSKDTENSSKKYKNKGFK